MKILCLHPWGTSADIFEKQMSVVCNLIGDSHTYIFVDGPISSGPAKELPAFTKGPFYSWYDGLSSTKIRAAHDIISEIIEDEGPFDGVIGFSQGASLALSMLYHHEINHPNKPPPFRFAVFFCSILSASPDLNFNAEIIGKYSKYYKSLMDNEDSNSSEDEETDVKISVPHHRAMLLLPGQKKALASDIIGLVRQLMESGAGHDDVGRKQWETRGGEEGFPRVYHPLVNKQRISIPTVHVIGRSDPLRRQSELQAKLCSKNMTRVIEFHGGHKVPRNVSDLQAISYAVDWAIRMAQLA